MQSVETEHRAYFEEQKFGEWAFLFRFAHTYPENPVDLSVYLATSGSDCILIFGNGEQPLGRIDGLGFQDDDGALAFEAKLMNNLGLKTPNHTPGVVGATVTELLTSGAIDRFYSSDNVLDPGKRMFARLARDERLKVVAPNKSNKGRFVVTARRPINRLLQTV